MKFTRIAYTDKTVPSVLAEIVNDAGLKDLPTMNSDLHARRHETNHPDQMRVTVIVERVGAHGRTIA